MLQIPRWAIEFYRDQHGKYPVSEWLANLDVKSRTRVSRTIQLLETYGPRLTMPHCRHLRGKIWELRTSFTRHEYRVLYFAAVGRTFVLLHAFAKKTDKTPEREIETAERRWSDYQAKHIGEEHI
jgi:phage-related protein